MKIFSITKKPTWFKSINIISILLLPISLIYFIFFNLIFLIKYYKKRKKIGKNVICIGNITIGGTGKTPITKNIAKHLTKIGYNVCILTKGYGRQSNNNIFAQKDIHTYNTKDIGDEAMLYKNIADVYIVNNRAKVPKEIQNYDYILMDDGYFDNSIEKNLQICTFDAEYLTGNGFILPAGPLRNALYSLKNCDFVILTNFKKEYHKNSLIFLQKYIKLNKILTSETKIINNISIKEKYIAFAGLGDNEKFFNTLTENAFQLIETIEYPDHHMYDDSDVEILEQFSKEYKCKLITTEKDFVKLPKNFQEKIEVIKIETTLDFIKLFNKKT